MNFARWSETAKHLPHTEVAEMVLDESGYTDMLKADKSAEAPGRLENLKEFVRSMESFESLAAFLEHVSLVMEIAQDESGDRINLMTLHAAKGLEFDTVFLPGWEEGLFPSQRTMDENGLAGLEEERRLAYVGLTRAKKRIRVSFAANRRVHGNWQSALPSRFITELPAGPRRHGGGRRFLWRQRRLPRQRQSGTGIRQHLRQPRLAPRPGQANRAASRRACARGPPMIDGAGLRRADQRPLRHAIRSAANASSTRNSATESSTPSKANKLTVDFDKAGEKKVIDQFVQRA